MARFSRQALEWGRLKRPPSVASFFGLHASAASYNSSLMASEAPHHR